VLAGIARHASIGFAAANLVRVNDEESGETLYWEYKSPGEALEGSLVWLGAQPGATVTKSAKDVNIDEADDKSRKEGRKMKEIMKALGLAADADTGEALQTIQAFREKGVRLKTLEEVVEPLGENLNRKHVEELIALSGDGKAYRKDLISRQIKAERLLGRTGDADDDTTEREKQLSARSLDEIRGDLEYLEKQAAEKFPGQKLGAIDPNDQRDNGEPGAAEYDFRKKGGK